MEDEQIVQSSASNNAGDESSSDSEISDERVFDISPDLKISPIKDAQDASTTSNDSIEKRESIKKQADKSLEKELSGTTPVNLPTGSGPAIRKPATIPLQDISATLASVRNAPANPATKTIRATGPDMTGSKEIAPETGGNLQSSVAAILPSNLKPGRAPTSPTVNNPLIPQNPNIKPLRTYEGDVADVMANKHVSSASMAMAESKKTSGEEMISDIPETRAPSHAARKLFMVLICLILIGGGVIGAYYLYSKSPLAPNTAIVQPAQQPKALITAESQALIHIDNLNPNDIQSRIQAEMGKAQTPQTIKEIILVENKNGSTLRVTAPDMISRMDIPAPDILTRSLTPDWMLGVYANQSGQKSIFVVFTNNFFQNAFAGMLQWENVMADDLKRFLSPAQGIANAPSATPAPVQALNPLDNLNSILPLASTSTAGRIATSSKNNSPSNATTSHATTSATTKKTSTASSTKPILSTNTTASTTASSTNYNYATPIQPYFTIRGQFEDQIIKNRDVRAFVTTDKRLLFFYSFIDNSKLLIAADESVMEEILTRLEKQAFVR